MNMKRKENFQILPKELHPLKYEDISVPQGSVHLVKKTQGKKRSTCYLLITKRSHELEPSTSKDPPYSIAIEVSSRPKLTGNVRGKAFFHVLRRRPIGCPDSRKRTDNARCDGYDSEQYRLD
ncbi:hypothetical protein TNCV_3657331 [Trichonephila clavipes]|nr:hypothetical protein TNCV_3657331 [Trichonephila clavipes]